MRGREWAQNTIFWLALPGAPLLLWWLGVSPLWAVSAGVVAAFLLPLLLALLWPG